MNRILVSIIIPTYNDWKRLTLCIDALDKQNFPRDMFEVIIVNNNPHDKTPSDILLPGNFKIMIEETPGSYAARNAALRVAKGNIIGFTDSDCIPDQNWIKNAVEHFEKNKNTARIAGSVSIFFKGADPTTAELYDKLFAFNQRAYVENSGTGVTANLFTYKYVFDKIGYFNDSLMSGGDFLWGTMAHKNGFKIDYVDNVIVNHPARKDLKELIKKEQRVGGSQAHFLGKKNTRISYFFRFLKELSPDLKTVKYVFINVKGLSIKDRILIYSLRWYLVTIRNYEKFRVRLGKKANRT